MKFASRFIHFDDSKTLTIQNARKTLLFNKGLQWQHQQQKTTGLSDVTLGGLDSSQVCELVGLFLLYQVKENFLFLNNGLYRDDGLACYKKMPGPIFERMKKTNH